MDRQLLITSGYASKPLEVVDAPFDDVAAAIILAIKLFPAVLFVNLWGITGSMPRSFSQFRIQSAEGPHLAP
jgi:hypothetical protein